MLLPFRILAALAITFFAHVPVFASDQGPGTISYVHAMPNGSVIFFLSGTRNAMPACAGPNKWAFDATTPAGQAKLSIILTAYASGKQISAHGDATCSAWPDSETLVWFHTHN